VVSDVDIDGGKGVVESIRAAGGVAEFVACDISSESSVESLIEQSVSFLGGLDFAVNNAGIEGPHAPTAEIGEAEFDRTVAVDLKGVWLCMRHELPAMLDAGGGSIVNTASVGGLLGLRGSAPYVAAKHGVVGLTKVAALEYAAQGVRVNAICPGVIRTPLVERLIAVNPDIEAAMYAAEPIGRLGHPDEIAAAFVWLCSDAASFVTGVALPVDGGYVAQ
jgi:NAD(P)-dependent dehydrogenase (short-subunit alcohol dehydrogenase family)